MGSGKFTNSRSINVVCSNEDHNSMAASLTKSDCEGSSPAQWMGLICRRMTVKRFGMLAVRVRKMKKALTVKIETVTLIGKGR